MLKALGSLLAPNIPAYYGIQLFQMLGWGLMTVSSVYFVNSIMDEQDAIKGQAYMTMTYTLASVIGALLGGTLIDHSGVTNMLMIATGSGLVGMVIMLLAAKHCMQVKLQAQSLKNKTGTITIVGTEGCTCEEWSLRWNARDFCRLAMRLR